MAHNSKKSEKNLALLELLGYSCLERFDSSLGLDCLKLAFASAANLGSGSSLPEGSFIAM